MRGALVALICVALAVAAPARSETVTVTAEGLRRTAQLALEAGQAGLAHDLASALLRDDPKDVTALVIASQALRDLSEYDGAARLARQAWQAADTPGARYAAALVMAQARASAGARTSAQLWLRRAVQNAPDDAARARAINDFRFVRMRNPVAVTLSFGIAPSSNINGGSANNTIMVMGLPFTLSPDARALAGTEATASATVTRRVSENSRHRTDLGLALSGRGYRLTRAAQASAPWVDAGDYSYVQAEAFVTHRFTLGEDAPHMLRFGAGRGWYGGAVLADFAHLDLSRDFDLGGGAGVEVGLGLDRQARRDVAERSSTTARMGADWSRPLGEGRLSLSVDLRRAVSDAVVIDHRAAGFEVGYALGRPVLGARLSARLGVEAKQFDGSFFGVTGRDDTTLSVGVEAFLPDAGYMGFAPMLGLTARRTDSNVALYETRDIGLSLGLKSAF